MKSEGEDKPRTRYECENCNLRTEVQAMGHWVSGIDKRQWWGIALMITTLLTVLGTLGVILFKVLPAFAAAGILTK